MLASSTARKVVWSDVAFLEQHHQLCQNRAETNKYRAEQNRNSAPEQSRNEQVPCSGWSRIVKEDSINIRTPYTALAHDNHIHLVFDRFWV
jgi:hypothetical protein